MRRSKLIVGVIAASVASLALAACGGGSGGSGSGSGSSGKITLEFSSYAWQDPTVAATKEIVSSWNAAHPNIQVKYIPADPDSVHDKLVTEFSANKAPDIIHDEAADIAGFVNQGYLADMTNLIPSDLKSSVPQGVWNSVTFNNKIYGAPTLLQSYVVFANKKLLDKAGIPVPTDSSPWTWDQFQAASKKLTTGGTYGLGWGLQQPTSAVLSMSLNFGAQLISGSGSSSKLQFGPNEQQVPQRIHDMIFTDKSIAPATVGMGGGDVLPGFFAGKYAMIVGGNYEAQQMSEQAPKGFQWVMLPLLKGTSQNQTADPQTISIAAQSKYPKQAGQFIAYYDNAQNLAKLAQGDWLIPASSSAAQIVATATQGQNGWAAMSTMGSALTLAPYSAATPYAQWKTQIATPAFQQYFGGKLTTAQLGQKLAAGWTQVAANS